LSVLIIAEKLLITRGNIMKARKFFDILRLYPNLDVEIFIQDGKDLLDVNDIVCDERNANLIITNTRDDTLIRAEEN
jgi:hypothetical protein